MHIIIQLGAYIHRVLVLAPASKQQPKLVVYFPRPSLSTSHSLLTCTGSVVTPKSSRCAREAIRLSSAWMAGGGCAPNRPRQCLHRKTVEEGSYTQPSSSDFSIDTLPPLPLSPSHSLSLPLPRMFMPGLVHVCVTKVRGRVEIFPSGTQHKLQRYVVG